MRDQKNQRAKPTNPTLRVGLHFFAPFNPYEPITKTKVAPPISQLYRLGIAGISGILIRKLLIFAEDIAEAFNSGFKAMDPKCLEIFKITQLLVYALYTALSVTITGKRLYDIWTEQGPYATKHKALWQKIKTTLFSGGMALSDVSIFGFSIAAMTNIASMSSPLGISLLAINGGINLIKYSWSIIRELIAIKQDHFVNGWRLLDKSLKWAMSGMLLAGLLTMALCSTPLTPIIFTGIMIGWATARIIHFFVKRKVLCHKIAEREAQRPSAPLTDTDIELEEFATIANPNLRHQPEQPLIGVGYHQIKDRTLDAIPPASSAPNPTPTPNIPPIMTTPANDVPPPPVDCGSSTSGIQSQPPRQVACN